MNENQSNSSCFLHDSRFKWWTSSLLLSLLSGYVGFLCYWLGGIDLCVYIISHSFRIQYVFFFFFQISYKTILDCTSWTDSLSILSAGFCPFYSPLGALVHLEISSCCNCCETIRIFIWLFMLVFYSDTSDRSFLFKSRWFSNRFLRFWQSVPHCTTLHLRCLFGIKARAVQYVTVSWAEVSKLAPGGPPSCKP